MVVLDAGVAIALLDADDGHHAATLNWLREHRGRELVLPVTAFAEALVGPFRRGEEAAETAGRALEELARVEPISRDVGFRAARLRAERPSLRLPDAIVVATAAQLGAEVLTTDERMGRAGGRITLL